MYKESTLVLPACESNWASCELSCKLSCCQAFTCFLRVYASVRARGMRSMNQEADCASPDTMIGIGMGIFDPTGVTFSSDALSAGSYCSCCANGGTCATIQAVATLYILTPSANCVPRTGISWAASIDGSTATWDRDAAIWTSTSLSYATGSSDVNVW